MAKKTMTIKAKLIANMMVTAAIIVGISLASFSSMRFLLEKLAYITEKSGPYQMRAVEFQRELQSCITNLVKVNSARTIPEYTRYRREAELSLGNAARARETLEKMNVGNRMDMSDELTVISGELFDATEARITSDSAARETNEKVSQQMKDTSTRLKELETNIRNLQSTRAGSFAQAMHSTGLYSAQLRGIEELRDLVTDLLAVSGVVHNSQATTPFRIAKGKVNAILGRIARSTYSSAIAPEIQSLTHDVNEFLQLQAAAISQKDAYSKRFATETYKELAEKLNHIDLLLNQDIEFTSSKLTIETSRQGIIFAQSNSANNILLINSELVVSGLTITGNITRLFTLNSSAEVDASASEIRSLFAATHERVQQMERSLIALDARGELKMLRAAHASLQTIRTELYAPDGIVATLKEKLYAIEQANKSADKLHAIVIKQEEQGKESVSVAQIGQEKAIVTVKTVILRSTSMLLGIGCIAIVIGILFGLWIYRSVLLPLRVVVDAVHRQQELGEEKAALAEAVAGGDLNRTVTISEAIALDPVRIHNDEMGMVLNAVKGMSEAQVTLDMAFAGMTASLRSSRDEDIRRDRLKNGLHELSKILREEHETTGLGDEALAFIAAFLGAGVGVMYLYDEKEKMLQALSTYAMLRSEHLKYEVKLGEGLVGQVALERKTMCHNSIPPNYLPITSALGEASPLNIAILPIMHNETLIGVLELGSFQQFSSDDFDFLSQALEAIAIALKVNRSRQLINELLEQTQAQSEELRVQQEEMQRANEERRNGLGCRRKNHDHR